MDIRAEEWAQTRRVEMPLVLRYFLPLCLIAWLAGQSVWYAFGKVSLAQVMQWKVTQYFMDYAEFGFVKRGLAGTALRPLIDGAGLSVHQVMVLALALDFAVAAGLAWLMARIIRRLFLPQGETGTRAGVWLGAMLVLSPVGFVQIGYEAGRLDHLNFLLFAGAAWAALRGLAPLAGGLMVLAVLNHEAAFVQAVPVVAALAMGRDRRAGLWVLGPAIAAGALVYFLGNAAPGALAALPEAARAGGEVWGRGLIELPSKLGLRDIPPLMFFTVVPYWLLWRFYRANGRAPDLLFLAALSPLALYALGFDYPRWQGLIFVTVLVVFVARFSQGLTRIPTDLAVRGVALAYMLPLGPVGKMNPLPLLW